MNTGRLRRSLLKQRGNRCAICGLPMKVGEDVKYGQDPDSVSIDHFWPQSWDGTNNLKNLRLAHYRCNMVRGNNVDLGGGFHVVMTNDSALAGASA